MKIGIITLPLESNYGGVLQNWALQVLLRRLGHEPITIDFEKRSIFRLIMVNLKTILLHFYGKKRPFVRWKDLERNPLFDKFIKSNINLSNLVNHYSKKIIKQYGIEAIIVGSDQVWRPKYSRPFLYDRYLRFIKGMPIKRIGFAISFGVDFWEYNAEETQKCAFFAAKFDALSFREQSGVKLCKQYLNCDAVQVLDPTLLISKDAYIELCSCVPVCREKYIASYIIDKNWNTEKILLGKHSELGIPIKEFTANKNATISIEEWLAMFRDAEYIVTDSFHGTAFSIIFGKKFHCIYNEDRGSERFISLLTLYNMGELEKYKKISIEFLYKSLSI